ncbi:hypothetical protein M8756_14405 [Lutimaribacter sp. EGI FJ00015]|uniref:Uncharacterized protein n=1 Tax=Lutimaribacter degradans TaxID=2945989 RepID=A0ACC6A1C8_9RHOB|nr:hypothetical protein [Lutimaribacter sp. EGI FJ00013]MCM2563414.1 hypothetical protein [Lutimaribacter sp. EGI FJ00013]MCO0614508.1 hypothetical protein [Lutimaribacter sp. EGI FJ00015]MCO0637181.1 hypothetical protein [Lutimaribacter sp. EGI FJ00014]
MSTMKLTKTRVFEGVWEGLLTMADGGKSQPEIEVTHLGQTIEPVEVIENREQGHWVVRVPIPAEAVSDGVQTFLITDADTGETLESFAVLAGDALGDDIRAEVQLLREELDMLKRAFRRHCVETM